MTHSWSTNSSPGLIWATLPAHGPSLLLRTQTPLPSAWQRSCSFRIQLALGLPSQPLFFTTKNMTRYLWCLYLERNWCILGAFLGKYHTFLKTWALMWRPQRTHVPRQMFRGSLELFRLKRLRRILRIWTLHYDTPKLDTWCGVQKWTLSLH